MLSHQLQTIPTT
jgi:hypothetical protein